MIVTATINGTLVTITKHYVPFMNIGSIIFTVACGLFTTLGVESQAEHWISCQILAGIGFGISFQLSYSALHAVLNEESPLLGTLYLFPSRLWVALL